MLQNTISVDTPESIVFDYKVAGVATRAVALLIDSILQTLIFVALLVLVNELDLDLDSIGIAEGWVIAIIIFVVFFVFVLYFAVFESVTHGQTPGKRLLNLRVVREDGQPLSPVDAILRNLIRLIDLFPGVYATGMITMVLNDRSKRLGDFAAGTIVIREGGRVQLASLDVPIVPLVMTDAQKDIIATAARRLDAPEAEIIESLLKRWFTLHKPEPLAHTALTRIAERIRLPELLTLNIELANPRALLTRLLQQHQHRDLTEA
jgi:uncharacterized RDD family membrane protein YckC